MIEILSAIRLSELPACEVSLSTVARNLRRGDSQEDAIKINYNRKAYCMKKRDRRKNNGRTTGSKNKPVVAVIKSVLPEYSRSEALAIMAPAVNPDKSRYHEFGVKNNPLDAERRRSRIR